MTYFWHSLCAAIFLLSTLTAASGGPIQALPSIVDIAVKASKMRAQEAGYENVSVKANSLDKRLRLPPCEQPLSTSLPTSGNVLGPTNVGVRCTGNKPWTIYVRTEVSALQSVPVLVRRLARNTIIRNDDLKLTTQPLQSSRKNIIVDLASIVGKELTRSLPAGSELRPIHLRAPKVIKRGQQVTVKMNLSSLEVRSRGKALNDAAEGEAITVTNLNSGKKVHGVALSDGTVIVR